MQEQASCPTKDPTRLTLPGQGLTVDPSCQSRRGLSRKQEGNRTSHHIRKDREHARTCSRPARTCSR